MANSENNMLGSDSRLKKSANSDVRGDRSMADSERTDRDGTVLSASERFSNFRDEWGASALPTPPAIPGYHLCWLSTTNSYDPIHKRMRMGYEPVKASDVPGYEHLKMKSGEFEGVVSCNEMLLFKVHNDLYQEMMTYFHHERPQEDENMLKKNPVFADKQHRSVAQNHDEDGFGQLGKSVKPPIFN